MTVKVTSKMSNTKEYKILKSLFISDPARAIEKSQELICSATGFKSYKEFYNYYLEHSHVSTCQNEWTKEQMSIHCNDCSVSNMSCICLQCFLNGNHQGHNYVINPNSTGNCDCGDTTLWKRTGFCTKHQGLEEDSHPEEYINEKLRNLLTNTIFKSAFVSLKSLLTENDDKLSLIFPFLSSFLKFGDGFRRLVTISLTERIDSYKLFSKIFEASVKFNELFKQFCGLLVNDQLFKENFSKINFKLMIKKTMPKALGTDTDEEIMNIWSSFWFHSYTKNLFEYNIDHNGWNWVKFCIKGLTFIKECLKAINDPKLKKEIPGYFLHITDLYKASQIQPNEQTQSLFDKISTEILTKGTTKGVSEGVNDTNIVVSYKEHSEEGQYDVLLYFNAIFYQIFNCFSNKKNLRVEQLFETFNSTIDISKIFYISKNIVESFDDGLNENDNLIKSLFNQTVLDDSKLNADNYRSFHNGSSFFISYPMFYSIAYLLRQDNLCRIKVAKILSSSSYRSLRIKIGIVALKSILSLVCLHQSLIPRNNLGAIKLLKLIANVPSFAGFGIPLFFPVLQLIVGIGGKKNGFIEKEFFAFEMAREIGLFDDFESDNYEDEDTLQIQKQMIFTFLYISILIVTERTLFNFDGYKFVREQIIFQLKNGKNNLNELKDLYDSRIAQSDDNILFDLNQVVFDVATVRQKRAKEGENENDVLFDLKDGIENSFFSAINSFNDEKILMNDEVTKHPDELIKLHQFEDEEDYFFNSESEDEKNLAKKIRMRLKEFLMTPTVLAVVYHTLKRSHNIELNDHLAMNILILISKFAKNSKGSDDFLNEATVIKYNSNVVDLISQLKKIVFKLEVDQENNATISNTLTKKAFKSLLKVKIECGSNEAKSFVDLLLEKGELGKKVLQQMKVKIKGLKDKEEEKREMNEMKKEKARKIKEEIMNHYKSITANFNAQEEIQQDELLSPTQSTEGETCSICSTIKEDDILCYPIYIYKTKFPFIVDKPPLVSMPAKEALNETEVFEDDINIPDELNEENLDKLESEIPKVDDLLKELIDEDPTFQLTDDTPEEIAGFIKQFLEVARNELQEKIDNQHQQIQQKRKELAQLKKMKEEKKKKDNLIKKELKKNPNKVVQKRVTPGNLFVIQFGICQHLVHQNCIDDRDDFTCPIDRSNKNGLLPNINDLPLKSILIDVNERPSYDNFKENFRDLLFSFSVDFENFFIKSNNRIVDLFVELVKSISGLIVTYEVRLRNLPDCLDSLKNFILARNLFLTTWYMFRLKGQPLLKAGFEGNETDEIDDKLTVFQRFIRQLIINNKIEKSEEEKNYIVKDLINHYLYNELKPKDENDLNAKKESFLFLKRVCLADHFLLSKNVASDEKFIDWDEVLSAESLSERYEIDIKMITIDGEEIEFKPFQFMKMPKEFIRFGAPPYNFPVDKTQEAYILDVLDYNYLIQNYNEFEDEEKVDESRFKDAIHLIDVDNLPSSFASLYSNKNYPSMAIFIGGNASDVMAFVSNKLVNLRPFYLDRFGCSDVGYKRHQPLFLNEDRYDRVMDEILSGDFTYYLNRYS